MSAASRIVRALEQAGFRPRPNPGRPAFRGQAWMAVCPSCMDLHEPGGSLGVGELAATGPLEEAVHLHCWAGCESDALEAALSRLGVALPGPMTTERVVRLISRLSPRLM